MISCWQKSKNIINKTENFILVWTILILAGIGFVQVFSRYLFNYSFTWFEELGRYTGVFITFMGASAGVRTGNHFAMDLVVTHMKTPFQEIVKALANLLSAGFLAVVVWFSWKIIFRMHGYGTTSPTLQIPMYIAYLPIPVFSMTMGLRFIFKAWESLKDIGHSSNGNAKGRLT